MADDKLVEAFKASRNSKAAPVKGKKTGKSSGASLLAGARTLAPIEAPAPEEKPKDWWETTTGVLHDAYETPVIKQIIDAISAPMYAVDNTLSNVQNRMYDAENKTRARAAAKGEEGLGDLGNRIQGAWEGLNPGSAIEDIVKGVGQGLSAGVGNKNDAKTMSDVIRQAQEFSHEKDPQHYGDPNGPEGTPERWIQGLGGFAGDVVMDPMNAVTGLGKAAAATKGAVRGSLQFKSEAAAARKTGEMAPGVENTRWANAKKQSAIEVEKYKELKATDEQAKEVRKATKNFDAKAKAEFLLENLSTLKPAVIKAMTKDEEVSAHVMAKAEDGSMSEGKVSELIDKISESGAKQAEDTVAKATEPDITPDIPVAAEDIPKPKSRPLEPTVGLSQFKEPTVTEKLFDKLSNIRATNKTQKYDKNIIKAVQDAEKARPATIEKLVEAEKVAPVKEAMTDANKVPDIKATIKALKEFDKEMRDPKNPSYEPTLPVIGNAGKKVNLPIADIIDTLDPRDALFAQNWDAVKEFQVYKAPEPKSLPPVPPKKVVEKNPNALTDEDYIKLGVSPDDVALIRQGKGIHELVNEMSVGDIRAITRDMRAGLIPTKDFHDVFGESDPKKVAKLIDELAKTDEFKNTANQMKQYGSLRTGETPAPQLGVSGHGKFAQATSTTTEADILAAKTPANPEATRAFLEAEYNRVALNLASHKLGPELRGFADELFKGTIDKQAREAGPLRAKGGASVREDKLAAKYEKLYNTHSGMWRMAKTIEYARGLEKAKKTTNRWQMDDVIMSVLEDVDARLRLAGFDQHLSNMQVLGDKLVVRLAPSDVLKVMTRGDRIKYLWGNKGFKEGSSLDEFLPTTILDLGEVLVRSITKLTPSGTIDEVSLVNNALHTLQGRFSEVAGGKRVIINNLDANTRWKNDIEIMRELGRRVPGDEKRFLEQYKAAKTPADRQAVIDVAKSQFPKEFKEIAERRLDKTTNDLMQRFLKGMKEGKPSPLTELININMRNAALMGGTVSRKVGEASAEYSKSVLDALEHGTLGDHLSTLVSRPPYKTTDPAIQAVLKENKEAVQHSVATPDEIKANEALNRNVEAGTKKAQTKAEKKAAKLAGNKANKDAFQKDPELAAEKSKPLDEVNTEKVYDLHARELNKDVLIRMFGTSRFFNKRSGIPISFETLTGSTHASSLLMTGFHEILRDLTVKGYTNEQLRVAFNQLKEGPPVDQISAELNAVISTMFDTSKTNFLARNSVGPEHFNKVLEKVGFDPEHFFVPLDATPAEMMNAWKNWDVVDVKDFFSKMMGAMVKTSEDVSMGASFSKHFGRETPAPGYVKVMDSGKGDMRNQFIDLIDQNLYYPEEIVGEFVHIGRLITESRSFKPGTALHTFVTKVMDPVVSSLKMTQTTLKPGHHVMSIIGDAWRNNLALSTIGFLNPARQTALYGESARILWSAVGDIEELSSFQKFQRSQGLTNELRLAKEAQTGKKGQGVASEYYPNIKGGGKIGHKDMYSIMQAHGIALPAHLGGMAEDFHSLEFDDLAGLGAKTASKTVNAVTKVTEGLDRLANPIKPKFGMKKPYSLNKFTANRDTWTRGALFLGAMRSRNFASVEEAVKFSAEFVQKWSPTAKDLGAFESKYLRRGVFYYTWIRGMVPRIIEGTLMRPGVATIPNKAMYNLAVANGIDPQSVGDPFPEGSLFPSWYTERVIGPQYRDAQGDLWGMNPTGPLGDVLNSLGSNVAPKDFLSIDGLTKTTGTLANMSNPFIKIPAEAIPGRTLETGAPIDDRAQYLQDYIGPARFASRATGQEIYPSLNPEGGVGFANRTESKYKKGLDGSILEPGSEVNQNALPEILNYLTGMGFTNYTSESAQKSAQFQTKDKLKQQQKAGERFK